MMKNKYLHFWMAAVLLCLWGLAFPFFRQSFTQDFYYMPFLGVIAATVANTTPAAAGIVYFPILTRLQIAPLAAVQFNMLIQAYGMGLGTVKWFMVNKRLFITNVLPVCLVGGFIGVFTGIVLLPLQDPKILTLVFNFIAFALTQFIFFSILARHKYPKLSVVLNPKNIAILFIFSFAGGLMTGWIGFGIDTIFYFVLTVIFQINPAASIITSITLMAAMSVFGSLLNILLHSVPISLWYSAIPGVTIAGLFLATFIAMKLGPKNVLLLFTMLLSVDFFVTFWTQQTLPMTQVLRVLITYALVAYIVFIHIKVFKKGYNDMENMLGTFKEQNEPVMEAEKVLEYN